EAETNTGLRIGRPLQQRAVGAEHNRKFFGQDAETIHDRPALFIVGAKNGVWIAVAAEEILQAIEISVSRPAYQHRAGVAVLDQPDPPQDVGAHHDLANLG